MPIYEFYCPACHTIYSFWSKRINTEKTPPCPIDQAHELSRRVSLFAISSGGSKEEEGDELDGLGLDESKLESAVASLAGEAEGIDENDPRAAAQLMRKFSRLSGLKYNESMEEALSRLESGEDPEQIESELGDAFEGDEMPFSIKGKKDLRKMLPPKKDETLYEM